MKWEVKFGIYLLVVLLIAGVIAYFITISLDQAFEHYAECRKQGVAVDICITERQ